MTKGIMPPPPPPPPPPAPAATTTTTLTLEDLADLGIAEVKTSKYSGKISDLSKEEYELLKKSIAEHGLYHPITINQSGDVLDGHHRLRACQELGIEPRFEVKAFLLLEEEDELSERMFVKETNLARRQLSDSLACELALSLKGDYQKRAKLNMSLGGKGVRIQTPLGRVDKQLATKSGRSTDTPPKVEQILQAEQENPEKYGKLVAQLRSGKNGSKGGTGERGRALTIHRAYNKIKKDRIISEKRAELAKDAKDLPLPKKFMLLNRDSIQGEIPEIRDSSVDLILTDPPYSTDMLYIFEWLAGFAARKLKQGGCVVFYGGQHHLDKVMAMFARHEPTLQYAWQFAVVHTGNTSRFHTLGIWPAWKAMLWFTKGDPVKAREVRIKDMSDLVESQPPDKANHEWAQSPTEADFIIKNLTLDENALVVDPFLGSGAFGIAAGQLDRYFMGIEIDREKYELAKLNIAQALIACPPKEEE